MSIGTVEFAFFVGVSFLIISTLRTHRAYGLLSASLLFYASFSPFFLIHLTCIVLAIYLGAIGVGRTTSPLFVKRLILAGTTLFVLSFLVYYKFYQQLMWMVNLETVKKEASLWIPIGLSFYSLQALSYLFDVYNRKIKVEYNVLSLTLFISYFPQLLAGPIERYDHLGSQFKSVAYPSYKKTKEGCLLVFLGLFKKFVFANNLNLIVSAFFSEKGFNGALLFVGLILFRFQLYFDFSGYTDIARGVSKIFNIELVRNFNRPFAATSVSDNWRRWHMSLGAWMRDYLFYPSARFLGGGRWAIALSLLLVFGLGGVWHGSGGLFLLWGLGHGVFYILEFGLQKPLNSFYEFSGLSKNKILKKTVQISVTFSAISLLAVLFRSRTIAEAISLYQRLLMSSTSSSFDFMSDKMSIFSWADWVVVFGGIVLFEFLQWFNERRDLKKWWSQQAVVVRWPCYFLAVVCVYLFGRFGFKEFIYFVF